MAHNVLGPQVESRLACNSCIVQLFHFGLCFPLGQVLAINLSSAAAFHPSDSTWLDWVSSLGCRRGRGELFNLCASDQFACRQTNFVMQSQALHLLLSRLERLTYVDDKSKRGVEPPTMWHTRWRTRWRRLFDLQQGSFKKKSRRKLKPGTCINKSPQT